MYEPSTEILPLETFGKEKIHVVYIDQYGNKVEGDVVPENVYYGSLDVNKLILVKGNGDR